MKANAIPNINGKIKVICDGLIEIEGRELNENFTFT